MEEEKIKKNKADIPFVVSVISALIIAFSGFVYAYNWVESEKQEIFGGHDQAGKFSDLDNDDGIRQKDGGSVLGVLKWNGLGKKLVDSGVIDREKLIAVYAARGGLSKEEMEILDNPNLAEIKVTQDNADFMLNILWAFGLANKSNILEKGLMTDEKYGGAGQFASTGGWTIAKGESMDHYSRHEFVVLDEEKRKIVEEAAKGIYRPCCDNPTHFPDCNHGMAMLGLLELLAYGGAMEQEMYEAALVLNMAWFPGQYEDIFVYAKNQGADIKGENIREILGKDYSGASGYQRIAAELGDGRKSGSGCGI